MFLTPSDIWELPLDTSGQVLDAGDPDDFNVRLDGQVERGQESVDIISAGVRVDDHLRALLEKLVGDSKANFDEVRERNHNFILI